MKQGFTLIETLFALFILIAGFFGIFNLMQAGMMATGANTNQLIASNLIQEGIEIIRNIRDSQYMSGGSWSDVVSILDTDNCLSSNIHCEIDASSTAPRYLGDDTQLKINANDEYNYTSGSDSGLRRWIDLTQGGGLCSQIATSSNCIQVKVTVLWQDRNKERSVSAEDYLYFWY